MYQHSEIMQINVVPNTNDFKTLVKYLKKINY